MSGRIEAKPYIKDRTQNGDLECVEEVHDFSFYNLFIVMHFMLIAEIAIINLTVLLNKESKAVHCQHFPNNIELI